MEQPPAKSTPKALLTRQRILDTALDLFASKGYEQTTMRDIATKAGCSLGLAYRYFTGKEELVLELYRTLVTRLEDQANQLAAGSIADRFQHIILRQFDLMTPHRATLGAIFGPALNPQAQVGVFGAHTSDLRRQSREIYIKMVSASKDAPKGAQIEEIATLLYGIQLALTLFWLQDLSPGTRRTYEFIAFLHDLLARLRPLLRLRIVAQSLVRLMRIVGPMLGVPEEG